VVLVKALEVARVVVVVATVEVVVVDATTIKTDGAPIPLLRSPIDSKFLMM
jgi:hypothetical protein